MKNHKANLRSIWCRKKTDDTTKKW